MTPNGGTAVPYRRQLLSWANMHRSKMFHLLGAIWISVSAYAADIPLKLVRSIPHTGYSEGLDFHEGFLWHALPTAIVKIDPSSGEVVQTFKPPTAYSESISWFQGKLWNVSYADNGIYAVEKADVAAAKPSPVVGDPSFLPFSRIGSAREVHAWGLTNDGKNLIFTGDHGSDTLYFFDPSKTAIVRTLKVKGPEGKPLTDLEDLAWDGKSLWTSSFESHQGAIFAVHPKTGKVQKFYSIPDPAECSVIDGIAYDHKHLWVTGKNCAKIYCFEIPKADRSMDSKAGISE